MSREPLILFDGVCGLCVFSVRFVIQRDSLALFRFASLQSPIGKSIAERHGISGMDTMVLVDDGIAYRRSTAALKIIRRLDGAWPLLYPLIVIPAPLRNLVYDFIGKRRYRWFGKTDECWIPQRDISDRFIDQDDAAQSESDTAVKAEAACSAPVER